MGYTTTFEGSFTVSPPLNDMEIRYLNKFSETRRMERKNGPYFVGGSGSFGQGQDADIINHNSPDKTQPSLWCQWVASDDGTEIVWDGGEKFYYAAEWMQYIIDHLFGLTAIAKQVNPEAGDFLQPHTFDGRVDAQGEESDDTWYMVVDDGQQIVTVENGVRALVSRTKQNLLTKPEYKLL